MLGQNLRQLTEVNPKMKRHRIPDTNIIASIAEMTIVFPKSGSFAIRSSGGKLVANIFPSNIKSSRVVRKNIFIMIRYNSSDDDN